jgi:ParB family chromosome partitioning protein
MASTTPTLLDVPVEEITPHPKNPRGEDLGDLEELAASIGAQGMLQRLVVRPKSDGHYPLVFGHRRLAAAKLAGLSKVPVEVRAYTSAQALAAMLGENFYREDLTPLQEARAFEQMLEVVDDDSGKKVFSQRSLAKALGISQKKISDYVGLFKLPGDVVGRLERGQLRISEAVLLVRLAKYPARVEEALRDFDEHRDVDMDTAVRRQQADLEREAKVAQTRSELEAAGARIAADDWRDQGGMRLGDGFHELDVAVEEHVSEPCHAAVVTYHGEVAYVCTDPKRHQPAEEPTPAAEPPAAHDPDEDDHDFARDPTSPAYEPEHAAEEAADVAAAGAAPAAVAGDAPGALAVEPVAEPSAEELEARERMEAARAAAEAERLERERLQRERAEQVQLAYGNRAEALRTLLGGRLSRPEATRLVANFLVGLTYQGSYYDDAYVRHALGLDEQGTDAGEPAVLAFAAKSDDTLLRAAVAVVADNVEELLGAGDEPDFTHPLVALYYGYLTTVAAYKPSAFERAELGDGEDGGDGNTGKDGAGGGQAVGAPAADGGDGDAAPAKQPVAAG